MSVEFKHGSSDILAMSGEFYMVNVILAVSAEFCHDQMIF